MKSNGDSLASRFPLGDEVVTQRARNSLLRKDIELALQRHSLGDWGNVSYENWKLNDTALDDDDKLISVYYSSLGEMFYVVTAWDRSTTTVLLPDEY